MQIEISENAEHILQAQAEASGCSPAEQAAKVISRYTEALAHPVATSDQFEIKTHEDAIIWILSRNPNIATNRPQDTDWQKVKQEGRRY